MGKGKKVAMIAGIVVVALIVAASSAPLRQGLRKSSWK